MGLLFATAGSKVEIGGKLAFNGVDLTSSSFTSQTWTEITGCTDIGRIGDSAQLITSDHVGAARTRKLKGTRNAGSMALVCDLDYADAGQLALIAAEKSKDTYAFRVTFNDAPATGSSPKPSQRLFVAMVMEAAEQLGGANNVMQLNATLEIDSNIVRVAASAT